MNDLYSQQDEALEKPPKRRFWQNLLIMDSGDLKKLLSLSSLMLALGILIVYILAFILLVPLIDRLIGGGPVILVNLAESLIPALLATGAVMLLWPLFRDKRVLPAAYLWLVLLTVVLLVIVLVKLADDPDAGRFFLYIFGWDVLPGLLIGNLAAWTKYRSFILK